MNGDEFKTLSRKLDELAAGQQQVEVTVAALRGVVDTTLKQHASELGELWRKHGALDDRVRKVEVDYVTQGEHERACDKNEQDHKEFAGGLDEQRTFSGKIGGGVAVLVAAAGVVVAIIGGVAWLLSNK